MLLPKLKKILKKIIWLFFLGGILVLSLTIIINRQTKTATKSYIYQSVTDVPRAYTGLVLGAQVKPNNVLSDVLKDRVDTCLELYKEGKIEKLLLSGDHREKYYDEVNTMKKYVLATGKVLKEDIFLDHAGLSTYDSLYRAKHIFGVDDLIICTQDFHLPRAVFIGQKLGLRVAGIISDKTNYLNEKYYRWREVLANVKAYAYILLNKKSEVGGKEVLIEGDGRKSWD